MRSASVWNSTHESLANGSTSPTSGGRAVARAPPPEPEGLHERERELNTDAVDTEDDYSSDEDGAAAAGHENAMSTAPPQRAARAQYGSKLHSIVRIKRLIKKEEIRVYPQQKAIAKKLKDKIFEHLADTLQSPLNTSFDKLVVCILLPKFVTLFAQTTISVDAFFEKYPSLPRSDRSVIHTAGGKQVREVIKALLTRVKAEPRSLFLLINDEAHSGTTNESQTAKLVNDPGIRLADNVVTLFVSATPYALQTTQSQVPVANEVHWRQKPAQYYGIQEYQEATRDFKKSGLLCADDEFERKVAKARINKPGAATRQKKSARSETAEQNIEARVTLLGEEYVQAILGKGGTQWTRKIVHALTEPRPNGKGIMVVIRVLLGCELQTSADDVLFVSYLPQLRSCVCFDTRCARE